MNYLMFGIEFHLTWKELSIVKSHAKTVVFSLTAKRPNIHVSPRRGIRITLLLIVVLK